MRVSTPPRLSPSELSTVLTAREPFYRVGGDFRFKYRQFELYGLGMFGQDSNHLVDTTLNTAMLGVPVKRIVVPRRLTDETRLRAPDAGENTEPLYAPGSILRVLVDTTNAISYGMPDTAAVYFTNSVTFDVGAASQVRVIARYPARGEDILLSGYLQGASRIAGKAAAISASVGRGRVVMFGFRPQHRGQSYGTFRMLFNALLTGGGSATRN